MIKPNSITEIMVGDHALISVLLLDFKASLGKNIELIEKSFDKFKWELEKHIFVEEKVIFIFCKPPDTEMCEVVKDLSNQHGIFFEMLNEMKNDLVIKNDTDTSKFQELLSNHLETEEGVLYPKLDQQLNEEQKETIIAQINEIPIKK